MLSVVSQFIFGTSGLFGSHGQHSGPKSSTWKDKSLCFDLRTQDLELEGGEQLIGCFYPIEDVKGNQDELGLMKVTNLRLIWICCKKKRVNLSIGWRTVSLAYEHCLKDALGGTSTSLFVLTKYESTKYEFVFNRQLSQGDIWNNNSQDNWTAISQLRKFSQEKGSLISHLSPMYLDDPFEVVFKVWQAYKQTHLFRHCRSNLTHLLSRDISTGDSSVVELRDINKLPSEQIIELFSGVVQSESRSVRYVGTLMLTNIRVIWIDDTLPLRNLSIPYIRVDNIKLKQGDRIVVNTFDYLASSTHVEFRVQKGSSSGGLAMSMAPKPIRTIFEQMQNLCTLYRSRPRFGPESCEQSINFMSHLRPMEHYLDSMDESMVRAMQNFGPEPDRGRPSGGQAEAQQGAHTRAEELPAGGPNGDVDIDNDDQDQQDELDRYGSKLLSYMNEQPIHLDNELVYSRELGLAIEKPANGLDMRRVWHIEV